MSSDQGNTLIHALVAEPYSSVQVRMGALQAVLYSENRVMCSLASCRTARCDVGGGRETHRHDYTRLPVALSDELGGLSTSLGLSASPSLILSTESVVVMVWKGMSTSTAASTEVYRERPPALQPTCSCPSSEQCRFAPCILLKRVSSRIVRGGANLRACRGVALHYAFVGR